MVKNSDVLFGRLSSTFQFVSREDIKSSVMEVSTSRVTGVKKNIAQVMYEKGLLNEDQIFAIYYSLVRSQSIKKVKNYRVCTFTAEDNEIICNALGLNSSSTEENEKNLLNQENIQEKFQVSIEDIQTCLNIQKNLKNSKIELSLVNILFYKKLLSPPLEELIPDIESKKHSLDIAKGFDLQKTKRCVCILLNQIMILNKKIEPENTENLIAQWEKVVATGLPVKYLEFVFYKGVITREEGQKVASFLKKTSGLDYELRLERLSDEEQVFFEKLQEQKLVKQKIIDESEQLLKNVQNEDLQIRLSDVLILTGHLKKEIIAKKWADSRRMELVKELQNSPSNTEEAQIDADDTEKDPVVFSEQEVIETEEFEKELDETFRSSQVTQRLVLQNEIKSLQERLKGATPLEVKTINTIIGHYQRVHQTFQQSFWATIAVVFFVSLGIFIAFSQKDSSPIKIEEQVDNTTTGNENTVISVDELYQKSQFAINDYRFKDVHATYLEIISRSKNFTDTEKLYLRANEFKIQQRLMDALEVQVDNQEKLVSVAKIRGVLRFITDEHFEIFVNGEKRKIPRKEILPFELYDIFCLYSLDTRYPWEMAIFSYEYKMLEKAKKSLLVFVKKFPTEEKTALKLYVSKTGVAGFASDYVVYQNDIISRETYEEIKNKEKQQNNATKEQVQEIKPEKKDPVVVWQNQQSDSLRERRTLYSENAKTEGKTFIENSWLSTENLKQQEIIRNNFSAGLVYFNDEWLNKEELGDWCEVFSKKDTITGYLKKTTPDLYILRSKNINRYLSSSQITNKIFRSSPAERYWSVNDKIDSRNLVKKKDFALWCQEQDLSFFTALEWEKILSLDPNCLPARDYQGYIFTDKWSKTVSADTHVLFSEKAIPLLKSLYLGLVNNNQKITPDFLALSNKKSKTNTDFAVQIFGGKPTYLSENRWRLSYNFENDMALGKWQNVTKGKQGNTPAILSGYLEVNSEKEESVMAYLDVLFEGSLQIKYEGQIAPNHRYDLRSHIYKENQNDLYSGYLLVLNWREDVNSKQSKNIIQTYQNNRFEIVNQTSSPTIPAAKWFTINIITSKEHVSLDIGGNRILRADNTVKNNEGGISFGTFASRVRFDDIQIVGSVSDSWYQQEVEKAKKDLNAQNKDENNWRYGLPISQAIYFSDIKEATKSSFNRCYQLLAEKSYQKAFVLISEILEEYPKNPFFLLTRARIYVEVKNYEKAIQDCTKAIYTAKNESKTKDELYTAYIIRGLAQQLLHREEEMFNDYIYAQTLAPDQFLPYFMLSNMYIQKDNYDKAYATINDYLQINSSDALAQTWKNKLEKKKTDKEFVFATKNYSVTTTTNQESSIVIAEYLQKLKSRFEEITGYKKSNITLEANITDTITNSLPYSQFSLLSFPQQSHFSYDFATSKIQGSTDIDSQILFSDLSTAATIQLIEKQKLRLPTWFKEGIISYFKYEENLSLQHYLKIIDTIQNENNEDYSLQKIALLSRDNYYNPNFLKDYQSYSYAWVYFFMKSPSENLPKYLQKAIDGGDFQTTFLETLGKKDQQSLKQEFIAFWKNIEPPYDKP